MPDNIIRVLLKGDSKQLQDALKRAESSLNKLTPKLKSVGRNLTTFVTLPLAGAGAAAIKFASDMEESTNKVNVAFGASSKIVKDFAETSLESFGIAEGSALDMAAMFGDMSTSMGINQSQAAKLSTQLVGLAGDLASFKNINIEEVTTALAGVFTGETESLKRLGVVMTEVNLEQFRMEQGIKKTYKEMSQAERVMLRYQYVMGVTSNAHGDFERTGGGAANQMRIFQESLKELAAEFGEQLLPMFTKVITKVNEALKEFKDLDNETKETIVQFGLLATAVPPLLWALGQLADAFTRLNTKMGIILVALVAATSAFEGMGKVLDQASTKAEKFRGVLQSLLAPAGAAARLGFNVLNKVIDNFSETSEDAFGSIPENVAKVKKAFSGLKVEIPYAKLPFGRGDKVTMPTPIAGDPLQELDEGIKQANKMAEAVDSLIESDNQLNYALTSNAANVESFTGTMATVSDQFTETSDNIKNKSLEMSLNVASMAQSIGNALTAAAINGGNAMEALAQVIFSALGDILIQMGTAAVAASKLAETFAIPGVGAAAGIAAIALGTLIKGISSKIQNDGFAKFANGGIVSTPTLGLVGEYAGARSNPEVIAPLDKLKSLIGDTGGSNVNVSGQFRLDGQDLVVALERANKQRNNFI